MTTFPNPMDSLTANNNNNNSTSIPSRKERLRLKREERIRREEKTAHHPTTIDHPDAMREGERKHPLRSMMMRMKQKQRRHRRCTGEAVQRAIALASSFSSSVSSHHSTSRVLLFTNGCPNMGMGSVVASSSDDKDVVLPVSSSDRIPSTFSKDVPTSSDHHVVEPSMLATAAALFRNMGTQALDQGVGIDVLCTGT
jgi:hypothetical protein